MRSLEILTSSFTLKFMKILCQMQNENPTSTTNELPVGNNSSETWKDTFFKKCKIQGCKCNVCYIKTKQVLNHHCNLEFYWKNNRAITALCGTNIFVLTEILQSIGRNLTGTCDISITHYAIIKVEQNQHEITVPALNIIKFCCKIFPNFIQFFRHD